MPVFEYVCNDCRRKFSALVGVVADSRPPACPKCGSGDLQKLVSRFARVRSEDEALDSLADAADGADLENPKALRRFLKEMGREIGEDADGEDIEEMIEQAMDEKAGEETATGGPEE